MTNDRDGAADRWVLLLVRLPQQPSRHRVAVWRELRRVGAVSLGQGTWAVPDVPVFAEGVRRAAELAGRGGGETIELRAAGRTPADAERFRALFDAARRDDWAEFLTDCGRYLDEIAKEIRTGKFTLAELEEEEQSLERLRRWHRDLQTRDVFGVPEALRAAERLRACTAAYDDYAERVIRALHET
ncbi:Chromate resistance protein ChrB [Marinitenerispora sediminis]|uniref:Chromate resistance protein ChrB n=1 Tax=Marinitenerispora sediminis TaxID=1931232 RepID=A0A368TAM6_9ACTN|nr:Chromate resistance protein ChrB [Marinitenerispora sediminis]RCV53385.1 chromate resistance protein ChrB [Marinitenerispora sediminis]RCV58419.1 chromate resistance protein ChrB [Marinitenerispora sediminis]RCV61800.1 chromate resistance protein ChrB [Marinitenerispora sediminis]